VSRRGKTVLMVTHDPSLTSRTTRNIIIADGLIVADSRKDNGNPSQIVKQKP
jgi:ABC-type lipoprotein export system ATPase subunit